MKSNTTPSITIPASPELLECVLLLKEVHDKFINWANSVDQDDETICDDLRELAANPYKVSGSIIHSLNDIRGYIVGEWGWNMFQDSPIPKPE